ncbi:hypothetical protein C8J56DRAFT_1166296 [Mycena floridula]|nr:hypothetical protein C8J56DRAFT_1166296 [Mycena floridula]
MLALVALYIFYGVNGVAATYRLSLPSTGIVNTTIPIKWTRDASDSEDFTIYIGRSNDLIDGLVDAGDVNSQGKTAGELDTTIGFNPGPYSVFAITKGDLVSSNGTPFNITLSANPTTSTSSTIQSASASITSAPISTSTSSTIQSASITSAPISTIESTNSASELPQTQPASISPSQSSAASPLPAAISSHSSNTAAVVGGTIGGIAVLILLFLALFLYRRRKQRTRAPITPFEGSSRFLSQESANSDVLPPLTSAGSYSSPTLSAGLITATTKRHRDMPSASESTFPSTLSNSHPSDQKVVPTSAPTVNLTSTPTVRQRQLQHQEQTVLNRFAELESALGASSAEVDRLREEVQWLRTQQNSDWALGLVDGPPPSYSS